MTEDQPGPPLLVRACACHDSYGISWDKDGAATETYEITRCAVHADRPSVYTALNRPPEETLAK